MPASLALIGVQVHLRSSHVRSCRNFESLGQREFFLIGIKGQEPFGFNNDIGQIADMDLQPATDPIAFELSPKQGRFTERKNLSSTPHSTVHCPVH